MNQGYDDDIENEPPLLEEIGSCCRFALFHLAWLRACFLRYRFRDRHRPTTAASFAAITIATAVTLT